MSERVGDSYSELPLLALSFVGARLLVELQASFPLPIFSSLLENSGVGSAALLDFFKSAWKLPCSSQPVLVAVHSDNGQVDAFPCHLLF